MGNILIADSDHSSANQLCEYFTERKFLAVPAYNGIDALVSANTIHPDVIITKAFLPGLDAALLMQSLSHLRPAPKFIVRSENITEPLYGNLKTLGTYHIVSVSEPLSKLCSLAVDLINSKDRYESFNAHSGNVISATLNAIGIPAAMSGYRYFSLAIQLCLDMPQLANSMMNSVYPTIALKTGTSPQSVEAAMRNALKKCWQNGTPQFAVTHLHIRNGSKRPCNSAFIILAANYVRNML